MTLEQLKEAFEKDSDYIKFDKVKDKLAKRPDLHAFLLLDKLVPGGNGDIVACAEHDQIWLDVNVEKLAEVVTEDQIADLRRCGVMYDDDTDSLSMFA